MPLLMAKRALSALPRPTADFDTLGRQRCGVLVAHALARAQQVFIKG